MPAKTTCTRRNRRPVRHLVFRHKHPFRVAMVAALAAVGFLTWVVPSATAGQPKVSAHPVGQLNRPLAQPPVPTTGAYLGIDTGGSSSTLSGIESHIGRIAAVVSYYTGFFGAPPISTMDEVSSQGSIPMVSWTCRPPDAAVADGEYDGLIRADARAYKAFGKPVFLRWFWEMNLPDPVPANAACLGLGLTDAQQESDYIAAYQRIWTIFQQLGATNVAFVWAPSAAHSSPSAIPFYPGSNYVNWIGTDIYDRKASPGCSGTCREFQNIYSAAYSYYSPLGKPIMITETGDGTSCPVPPRQCEVGAISQAQWLQEIQDSLPTIFPHVHGVVYVDDNRSLGKYTLVGPGLTQFRDMARSNYFSELAASFGPAPSAGAATSYPPAGASAAHGSMAVALGATSPVGILSTIAGTSQGTGSSSMAQQPVGLASGPAGLVIADDGANLVRLLAPGSGTESVIAGDGVPAVAGYQSDGRAATRAELTEPTAVALDPAGDTIIADTFANRIRLVAASNCSSNCPYGLPAPVVAGDIYSIVDKSGIAGYGGDGGPATGAEVNTPSGLAIDLQGDLLIADTYNDVIRLVAAASCSSNCPYGLPTMTAGDIYTIAGDSVEGQPPTYGLSGNGVLATQTSLAFPTGIAVDGAGDAIVADAGSNTVSLISYSPCAGTCEFGITSESVGDLYTLAGTGTAGYVGDDGAATVAELDGDAGVAVDAAGNVLVADTVNNVIRLVAGDGCSAACPYGLTSTVAGDIYTIAGGVSDPSTCTGSTDSVGDGCSATLAELDAPVGLAVDSAGNVLVTDTGNSRVRMIAAASCSSSCAYGLPSTTALDIYTVAGNGLTSESGDGAPAPYAELDSPNGVAVDHQGDVVIADTGNNRIRFVPATSGTYYGIAMTAGDIYTIAGDRTLGYSGDGGPAVEAELADPGGIGIGPAGDIVFADTGNNWIRLVAAAKCTSSCPYGLADTKVGAIYTVAGTRTPGYKGDGGSARHAELSAPAEVAVGPSGDLLIADSSNNAIRLVADSNCTASCPYGLASTTVGDIYTVAGRGKFGYSGDGGSALDAKLASPRGVAIGPSSDLIVSDTMNNRIRLVAEANCTSDCPYGLASTTVGDIYTVAGNGDLGNGGSGDLGTEGYPGPATSAELAMPLGVTTDAAGDIFVADSNNDAVEAIWNTNCSSSCPYGVTASPGYIATVAGRGLMAGSADGEPSTSMALADPVAVASYRGGAVIIVEAVQDAVRLLYSSPIASTTTIASTTRNPVVGEPITIGVQVAGRVSGLGVPAPSEFVTVSDGTRSCTAAPLSGAYGIASGTCTITEQSAGPYSFTASYSGDSNFGTSDTAGGASVTVGAASTITTITSSTPNPVVGETITIGVQVAGQYAGTGIPAPYGAVTVSDGTRVCEAPLSRSNGNATGTCSIKEEAAGSYSFTANYPGNANFGSSSIASGTTVTVGEASTITTITSTTPNPVVGEPITIGVKVAGQYAGTGIPAPYGAVTVSDGTRTCEAPLSRANGNATGTCSIKEEAPGSYFFTATYAGNANFDSSSTASGTSVTVGKDTSPLAQGFWLATANGSVFAAGKAPSLAGCAVPSSDPVVGIAATSDGKGYWLVTADGIVCAFGDAHYHGSLPALGVRVSNIVAITPTGNGGGYWMIGRDGGEFAFGDAKYHGSLPGLGLHVNDIVGMVATSDGGGYWIVGSDGGVFALGNTHYVGSVPGLHIDVNDIRAMIPSPTREGYVLVGSDGGAFVFGRGVHYYGSLPGRHIVVSDIVGLALTPDTLGYWFAGGGGGTYAFGDAKTLTPSAAVKDHLPVVGIAAS
jgi:Bacterial Ig-like domain (group 3)/NHL repeat